MQDNPEKIIGNYNEFNGGNPHTDLRKGFIDMQSEGLPRDNQREIIDRGLALVNNKINEIFGGASKLTEGSFVFPKIRFLQSDPDNPYWAGYFYSEKNEISLIMDKIENNSLSQTKVFIHEYIHFLSHNGRDDGENINNSSPIAQRNNVGFRRNFGIDIRKDKEGAITTNYFLPFNEAVTEQLAIDILPGVHEAYSDYRGLLNQVTEDAHARGLGSKDKSGVFRAWSKEQFKNYIYVCFFKGDLEGFTTFLQGVYKGYDISEQQFGLMTTKDDLPSVIVQSFKNNNPESPPPSPGQVAILVRQRLDNKKPSDYITDIIGSKPDGDEDKSEDAYGAEYDSFVEEGKIEPSSAVTFADGRRYDVDNLGSIIYRGNDAVQILNYVRGELDKLLVHLGSGKITSAQVTEEVDRLLFDKYRTSMLTEGFRDLYVYKHMKLAKNKR